MNDPVQCADDAIISRRPDVSPFAVLPDDAGTAQRPREGFARQCLGWTGFVLFAALIGTLVAAAIPLVGSVAAEFQTEAMYGEQVLTALEQKQSTWAAEQSDADKISVPSAEPSRTGTSESSSPILRMGFGAAIGGVLGMLVLFATQRARIRLTGEV